MVNYQLLTGKPVIVVFNTDESGPELSFSSPGAGHWISPAVNPGGSFHASDVGRPVPGFSQ